MAQPVVFCESHQCGKTLLAARDYRRGNCILVERPLVSVAAGEDALYDLADAVLATPGLASRLCIEFGRRVARIELAPEQLVARRRYIADRVLQHPLQPIPLLLQVLAALNLQVGARHALARGG